jgi:hypothetical protein
MRPDRVLNEKNAFFGLGYFDAVMLVVLAQALNAVLSPYGLEIAVGVIVVFTAVSLIGVRLKYRRGIIRDTISYNLRGLRTRRIYSPIINCNRKLGTDALR